MPSNDPADLVVLLDEEDNFIGTAPRMEIHGPHTPLHLAFSSYLFDQAGRLLLTRRALDKQTWPGVWTNSCCGHPRPGERIDEAVTRRVGEELGAVPQRLRVVLPHFRYRAVDAGGVVENEMCPVFLGRIDHLQVHPAPGEVAEVAWLSWPDVVGLAMRTPMLLSPWSVQQVRLLERAMEAEPALRAAWVDPDGATGGDGT